MFCLTFNINNALYFNFDEKFLRCNLRASKFPRVMPTDLVCRSQTPSAQGLIAFSISVAAYTESDKALRGKSLATTDYPDPLVGTCYTC